MKIKRTQKMKPMRIFIPIERVNAQERTAEGYAFVNEVVEGEGGVRLKRTTMQKATDDYMRWGAVREMHESKAAGTALQVKWDGKGALLRAKIVDDAAWKKVQEGVYKGFSVGVRATQMRGLDVEKALWIETSLVDRPADPDAVISLVRAATDDGGEADVTIIEDEDTDAKELRKTIKRLEKENADLKAAAGAQGGSPDIQRLQSDNAALIARVEGLEKNLKAAKTKRKEVKKQLERVLKQPASVPPVRYPSALQRDFSANEGKVDDEVETALKEFNDLRDKLGSEPDAEKRQKGAARLNFLKGGLLAAGVNI